MKRKKFQIEQTLREIKFQAEYALNNLDHYGYGEKDAKQRTIGCINSIEEKMQRIKDSELDKFVFHEE